MVTLCLLSADVRSQDEVAAFRITDIEGHVELRYRQDEDEIGSGGTAASEKRTSTEEEFFVLAHGYVYHPKFLTFDLGGGPLFSQTELETVSGTVSSDSDEYNLTARLRFLEDKPYPLLLYYDKEHPSIALSVTDRFEQENEKYGFQFKLRPPIWPVSLTLGASHHETTGQGFNTRIDNEIDEATARLEVPFSKSGHAKLTFSTTDAKSRSGIIGQPVEEQKTTTDSYVLDTRNVFGYRQQYQLTNFLSYLEREETRPLKVLQYTPEFRWAHSEDLHSFYRLNYSDTEQETGTEILQSTTARAVTGLSYKINKQSNASAELHYEDNDTTGLEQSSYGSSAFIDYKKSYTDNFTLQLSAGLAYDYFDREVTANVPVSNRQIVFSGTTPQFLPEDNIILSTIQVAWTIGGNEEPLTAAQVASSCTAGVIVEITTIGSRTQVRLCSAADDANNPYIFDYEYDPGGTVAYTNLTQNYQANMKFYQYFDLFARVGDTRATVQSGIPTLPLGEATNTQYGARVDYPIYESFSIGGEITIEEEEGTLLSFDREATNAYFQFGFFNGVGRLGTYHVTVDYLESTQDVDLVRNTLQFRVRPWNSVNLTVDLSDEEDTGGGNQRRSQIKSLQADWRVRKFTMRGEARFVNEEYAGIERNRSLIKLTLRREF